MTLKIKMILLERNMTIKQLSDNLSERELRAIADALNCDYDGIFTFRDTGKQI